MIAPKLWGTEAVSHPTKLTCSMWLLQTIALQECMVKNKDYYKDFIGPGGMFKDYAPKSLLAIIVK